MSVNLGITVSTLQAILIHRANMSDVHRRMQPLNNRSTSVIASRRSTNIKAASCGFISSADMRSTRIRMAFSSSKMMVIVCF
jgi:hypothetical protein